MKKAATTKTKIERGSDAVPSFDDARKAHNAAVSILGGKLHVEIPIHHQPSHSGRSTIIASTSGCHAVDCMYEGKMLRLNLIATYKNSRSA